MPAKSTFTHVACPLPMLHARELRNTGLGLPPGLREDTQHPGKTTGGVSPKKGGGADTAVTRQRSRRASPPHTEVQLARVYASGHRPSQPSGTAKRSNGHGRRSGAVRKGASRNVAARGPAQRKTGAYLCPLARLPVGGFPQSTQAAPLPSVGSSGNPVCGRWSGGGLFGIQNLVFFWCEHFRNFTVSLFLKANISASLSPNVGNISAQRCLRHFFLARLRRTATSCLTAV